MNQSEFEANTRNRRQARENACERGTVGFGSASHWLRKWREFWQPIIERREANEKANANYFLFSDELTRARCYIFTKRGCTLNFPFWAAPDARLENGAIFGQCARPTVCYSCTYDAILATFLICKRYSVGY